MKRLFVAFAIFPATLFAQEISAPQEPLRRHEFGINLFSVTDFTTSRVYNIQESGGKARTFDAAYHPLSGLYYKFHTGKNVFRAALDYDQQVIFINTGTETLWYYNKVDAIRRTGGLRIGYERELGSKRFVPFVAGDLAFTYSNYHGKQTWWGCFGGGENVPFTEHTYEGGISAGGGVKFKATDRIQLTLETTAQVFIRHRAWSNSPDTDKDIGFRYNPVRTLGVSLSF